MLEFSPITLDKSAEYMDLYSKCEEKSTDYTFTNLWCWNEKYRFEWAFADDLCWLRHHENETIVYNAPVGRWNRPDWEELLHKHFKKGFEAVRVPDYLTCILSKQLGETFVWNPDRDHFEYVYSIIELISLNGYRFRNKRKLSNQFKQYYNYIFKKLTPDLIPDVKAFQIRWLNRPDLKKDKNIADILTENTAVMRMLDNWENLPDNVFGGVLIIDNKIMAFALGEKLDEDTIAIHFEKASYDYKGAYAAINRITLETIGSNFRFVNREQDLGVEGLRKVKLEYNPVRFIKKYRISKHA